VPPPVPDELKPNVIRVAAATPKDGSLTADAVVSELNAQLRPLNPCVAIIRKTDKVVGSLHVEIEVSANGQVSAELRSPTNAEAECCLIEGMRQWDLPAMGEGNAMVLLMLEDDKE